MSKEPGVALIAPSFMVRCAALVGGLVLSWAIAAHAQTRARVALVTTDPTASSTRRLEAELLDLGVEVRIIEPEEPGEPIGRATLERLARQVGAFAAIRVVPVAAEVEVWVADRVTGKTVVREILHGDKDQSNFDDAIAVGAVELLRASLLEVASTEHLQGEVPPPEVVERIVPRSEEPRPVRATSPRAPPSKGSLRRASRPSRGTASRPPPKARPPALAIALEPAIDLGLDRLPHAAAGQVLARAPIAGEVEGEFATVVPISPARLQGPAGEAEVSVRWFALSGVWTPQYGAAMPLLGLGVAAVRAEAWGAASDPNVGQRQHVWVVAPVVRAGFAFALSPAIRVRVDLDAAYTSRPVPIRFLDEQVASWGRPAVLIGAGVEAALALLGE